MNVHRPSAMTPLPPLLPPCPSAGSFNGGVVVRCCVTCAMGDCSLHHVPNIGSLLAKKKKIVLNKLVKDDDRARGFSGETPVTRAEKQAGPVRAATLGGACGGAGPVGGDAAGGRQARKLARQGQRRAERVRPRKPRAKCCPGTLQTGGA